MLYTSGYQVQEGIPSPVFSKKSSGGSFMISRILAVFLVFALLLAGQTVSTEILGLVTDSSGAVLAGATVTAKRPATNDVRTTKTNETGNYTFPLLDIGQY